MADVRRSAREMQNRLAKAARICDFIEARGIIDQALDYSDAEWAELAAQADEKPPSPETRVAIVAILHERLQARKAAREELERMMGRQS
jgi:hypothetical protein